MINILVADDDQHILDLVSLYMENIGLRVFKAKDGKEALTIVETKCINLAVIDIMMPNLDGYELCKEIRTYYEIPVIMVTAKSQTQDKIKGFEQGVDDYIVKPFDPMELVMRVKAVLRRYRIQTSRKLTIDNIELDSNTMELIINKEERLLLPMKEFELLFKLASYPNQIYTRTQLIEQIWGHDYEGDERTVDVHIKRIREKLRPLTSKVQIKTIRGLGYRLEVEED
ncbi:response regulator transcription factor [Bacillus carboniphilus]|uniref:Heme response regulator HssR n=1 Tax=Bacillus carboniphilus TaxID=86663 RepID=A0ABY9JSJ5_9BACI|nr:response regulator transcription factor [Bacillus carboniphilus]WLR41357.1 response regulator transcription factor [Bacillus carboniphilus]